MCSGDASDADGREIQCWSDANVRWVTDELAQQIKAAAAATSDFDHETEAVVHAPLSQTVHSIAFIFVSTNGLSTLFFQMLFW